MTVDRLLGKYWTMVMNSIAFILFSISSTTQADGISWLETQSHANGRYANPADVANELQSTANDC